MLARIMLLAVGVGSPAHTWVGIPEAYAQIKQIKGKLRYVVADRNEVWLVEVDPPKGLDWSNGLTSPKQGGLPR